jgi:hypothetical protein
MSKENRLELVEDLLEMPKLLHETVAQLAMFDWNYEGECVTLKREHIFSVLERYLLNQVSSDEVEYWANQVEGRDDVVFEEGWEHEIGDVIYQLANPVLTGLLNMERRQFLLEELRGNDRYKLAT